MESGLIQISDRHSPAAPPPAPDDLIYDDLEFDEVLVLVKTANPKLYDEFRSLFKRSSRIYAGVNIVS